MPKRKVVIETISEFIVEGPDLTKGWVKVYRNYPVTAEFTNPKNAGGEIWDWAQSNWPDFAEEEQFMDLRGVADAILRVAGKLRWVCVTGVLDAKGKKSLPIAETYHKKSYGSSKKKKKPVKKAQSSHPTGGKKAPAKAKTANKPKPQTELQRMVSQADVDTIVTEKIQKAMAEES